MRAQAFGWLILISLMASPVFSCCLFENVARMLTKTFAGAAIVLEAVSSGTSYALKDESGLSEPQQKEYLVQSVGFAVSTVSLLLAISCCSNKGGMGLTTGMIAGLAGTVGAIANIVQYSSNANGTNTWASDLAFHTGLFGFAAHIGSIVFSILKSLCQVNIAREELLDSA